MAYFEDLSVYEHHGSGVRPGTLNVGWLAAGHAFVRAQTTDELLSLLWTYCKVSTVQMRGIHECDLCPHPDTGWPTTFVTRNGANLLLGSAEIRVFSSSGVIYAAPTQIYHYVAVHQYAPPDEFIEALSFEPSPSEIYFEKLRELGLTWNKTSSPVEMPVRYRPAEGIGGKKG